MKELISPVVLVVTGASGAGKTTLVRALANREFSGVRCYYFDSIGVPSPEEMLAEFGSGEAWQRAMLDRWMSRLAANEDDGRLLVLDGQVRPSDVIRAFRRHAVTRGEILLVECEQEIRERRLAESRGQPELASPRMESWAAYLRGQADALGLASLDTTHQSQAEAENAFITRIQALAASRERFDSPDGRSER